MDRAAVDTFRVKFRHDNGCFILKTEQRNTDLLQINWDGHQSTQEGPRVKFVYDDGCFILINEVHNNIDVKSTMWQRKDPLPRNRNTDNRDTRREVPGNVDVDAVEGSDPRSTAVRWLPTRWLPTWKVVDSPSQH